MIDISSVPVKIRPEIARELKSMNRHIVVMCRKTSDPDGYLYGVIARTNNVSDSEKPYSVHIYNSSLKELNIGLYDLRLSQALRALGAKISDVE